MLYIIGGYNHVHDAIFLFFFSILHFIAEIYVEPCIEFTEIDRRIMHTRGEFDNMIGQEP